MSLTELFFLKHSELVDLNSRLSTRAINWLQDWSLAKPGEANCEFKIGKLAIASEVIEVNARSRHQNIRLSLILEKKDYRKFVARLVQSQEADRFEFDALVSALFNEAISDIAADMLNEKAEAFEIESNSLESIYKKKNYGELIGLCQLKEFSLYFVLESNALKQLCDRSVQNSDWELHEARRFLGEKETELSMTIGKAKIKLSELQNLGVGDVVVLDRLLDEPCEVRVGSSDEQLSGILASHRGERAIRFV